MFPPSNLDAILLLLVYLIFAQTSQQIAVSCEKNDDSTDICIGPRIAAVEIFGEEALKLKRSLLISGWSDRVRKASTNIFENLTKYQASHRLILSHHCRLFMKTKSGECEIFEIGTLIDFGSQFSLFVEFPILKKCFLRNSKFC